MGAAGSGQGLHRQTCRLGARGCLGSRCQAYLRSCCCVQLRSASGTASEPAILQGMELLPYTRQVFSPTLQLPSCCNERGNALHCEGIRAPHLYVSARPVTKALLCLQTGMVSTHACVVYAMFVDGMQFLAPGDAHARCRAALWMDFSESLLPCGPHTCSLWLL